MEKLEEQTQLFRNLCNHWINVLMYNILHSFGSFGFFCVLLWFCVCSIVFCCVLSCFVCVLLSSVVFFWVLLCAVVFCVCSAVTSSYFLQVLRWHTYLNTIGWYSRHYIATCWENVGFSGFAREVTGDWVCPVWRSPESPG